MKKKILLLTILAHFAVFSQQKSFTINWEGENTIATERFSFKVPAFNKENFNYSLSEGLQFISQWATPQLINENSVEISNVNYGVITKTELKGLNLETIPNDLKFKIENSVARNKRYAFLTVSPIIKQNGVYKKVNSFSIIIR